MNFAGHCARRAAFDDHHRLQSLLLKAVVLCSLRGVPLVPIKTLVACEARIRLVRGASPELTPAKFVRTFCSVQLRILNSEFCIDSAEIQRYSPSRGGSPERVVRLVSTRSSPALQRGRILLLDHGGHGRHGQHAKSFSSWDGSSFSGLFSSVAPTFDATSSSLGTAKGTDPGNRLSCGRRHTEIGPRLRDSDPDRCSGSLSSCSARLLQAISSWSLQSWDNSLSPGDRSTSWPPNPGTSQGRGLLRLRADFGEFTTRAPDWRVPACPRFLHFVVALDP